ncbi:MAG: hypothetical protein LBS41_06180 [Streptococcaceae bacterium]|jgi:hypothetical protein|nr:hypothetical protein [Streptococcaceae bacterium]
MLISKKKMTILTILILIIYSICYVKFLNPISDILNGTIRLSTDTTIAFFKSVKKIYENLLLQFGFRILIFIFNIWLFKWLIYGLSRIEKKVRKINLEVNLEEIRNLAYDIALLNLVQYFCLALCAVIFGQQLILVSYTYFIALQLFVVAMKVGIVYVPFIRKTRIIIIPLICIVISVGISIIGVILK